MDFKQLIQSFFKYVKENNIEIYNEFALQFKLGLFLRTKKEFEGYKIQFERNVKYFCDEQTIKHEIDIVIFNDIERYAIELKFPNNGQYPEQMYSFIKDIVFMEQLATFGFTETYLLTLVKDNLYCNGTKTSRIY